MKFEIKGIFVKSLLIILAISFVMFGVLNFFSGVGSTNIVKINNNKISINKFIKFTNDKRSRLFQSDLSNKDIEFINSKDFVKLSLKEFVNESLIQEEIKKLDLVEPKKVIFETISKDPTFKNENGEFDLVSFKNLLNSNQITENQYIEFVGSYEAKNNLNQLINGRSLSNNFFTKDLSKKINQYAIVDIIEIKPESLEFDYKKPSNEEIKKYYTENLKSFFVPEEKIISSVDIDLNKYKDNEEELKTQLSKLEDLTLSAKNIDEISNIYKVKKNTINYFSGDNKLPEDLNSEILQYGVGTFSNLIYKDNNIYRIYFIEATNPPKTLTLEEANDKIIFTLIAKNKEENSKIALEKLIRQMRNNGVEVTVFRNGLNLIKNRALYSNDIIYSDEFINEVLSLKNKNSFTNAIFDSSKNIYEVALLKEIKEILPDNKKFLSSDDINRNLDISYKNSLTKLFEDYLYNDNKIIINVKLLETLN